jgi:hypothetical protein
LDHKGVFIASTGQNIGKTTTSLGLIAGFISKGLKTSFMKPVGQEQVEISPGEYVDKDVLLMKEHFNLEDLYENMSPVLIPQGFTKDFIDEKIFSSKLEKKIQTSYQTLCKNNEMLIVEGTGHVGVGSIIKLNNAQVARALNLPMILIASGGLGSAFDELTLNKTLCDYYNVKIIGVILNRVKVDKTAMINEYMSKALQQWNIPLLGCLPFDYFLSTPSMQDLELLFNTSLLSGEEHRLRHFKTTRLVATSVDVFREMITPQQIIITPANREDIILAIVSKQQELKQSHPRSDLEAGLILTGELRPRHFILEQLQMANIPMIYIDVQSHIVMEMLTNFKAKIQKEDSKKIQEAIEVVNSHIDFDLLLDLISRNKTA